MKYSIELPREEVVYCFDAKLEFVICEAFKNHMNYFGELDERCANDWERIKKNVDRFIAGHKIIMFPAPKCDE